jgi:CSLREA domain-containing protein
MRIQSLRPMRALPFVASVLLLAGAAAPVAAQGPAKAVLAPVPATPILVNSTSDATAAGDGLCTLREAIAAADSGTASGVAAGECQPGSIIDLGLVAGQTVSLFSDLPALTVPVTIHGHLVTVQAQSHLVITNSASGTSVDQLLINGANGPLGGAVTNHAALTLDSVQITNSGGGHAAVYSDALLTIKNSTFSTNAGTVLGAIEALADLTVSGSTFFGNASVNYGGAINLSGASLKVTTSEFVNNGANNDGGAIHTLNAVAAIATSTFISNYSLNAGGAIVSTESSGGSLTVANSTFASNTASGPVGWGGAIAVPHGDMTILNSTFAANSATHAGGAVYGGDGTNKIANSILTIDAVSSPTNPGTDEIAGTIDTATANVIGAAGADLILSSSPGAHGGPTPTILLAPGVVGAIDAGNSTVCASPSVNNLDQRGLARDPGACDIGAVEIDHSPPVVTAAPSATLLTGTGLAGSAIRLKLTWAGHDVGNSGLAGYELDQSVNGGAWTTVPASQVAASATVVASSGTSMRYRVIATDNVGNAHAPVLSALIKPSLVQQTATGTTYTGTWHTQSNSVFVGGSEKYSTAKGASVTYVVTARGFAWVAAVGPTRGSATVYINGVKAGTVNLHATTAAYRYVAFGRTYTTSRKLTVKIVVAGTSGHPRVDVDGFVALR